MSLSDSATAKIQEPDIYQRILINESLCIHQRAADRDTGRFKVIEVAVLEAFGYAGLSQQHFRARVGFATARSYAFALYGLPSGAPTIRTRRKLYVYGPRCHRFLLTACDYIREGSRFRRGAFISEVESEINH